MTIWILSIENMIFLNECKIKTIRTKEDLRYKFSNEIVYNLIEPQPHHHQKYLFAKIDAKILQ